MTELTNLCSVTMEVQDTHTFSSRRGQQWHRRESEKYSLNRDA